MQHPFKAALQANDSLGFNMIFALLALLNLKWKAERQLYIEIYLK